MSGLLGSHGQRIRHESEGWGSRHFLSQKLWPFHKNIRSRVEINAVARAQLTFQRLTLLQNIYTARASVQKHWDSKCLALIAQMVRAFGMSPMVVVRVPLRSRHFLSQKFWRFPKNTQSCVENECCCPRTVNMSNVNFTSKISVTYFVSTEHQNKLYRMDKEYAASFNIVSYAWYQSELTAM